MRQIGQMSQPYETVTTLSNNAQLSKETGNLLALIMDPFHDFNLAHEGYPDGSSIYNVIVRYQNKATIKCPFTLSAGEKWQFHVFTTPIHNKVQMAKANYDNNVDVYGGTDEWIGPVNILYTRYNTLGTISELKYEAMDTYIPSKQQDCRTVSLGFEIHDVSPELYKQGSVTVYRTNSKPRSTHTWLTETGKTSMPYSFDHISRYPIDIGQAEMVPNTRTWKLEDGVYAVSLPMPDNDYHTTSRSNIGMQVPSAVPLNEYNFLFLAATPGKTTYTSWSPLCCVGAISSVLSDATNLSYVLSYKQTLEIMPKPGDSIMSFARKSPTVNKQFLLAYKELINLIPPGTKVGNNASGDWFRSIVRIAKAVLPTVVSVLPGPAKMVGSAALPVVNKILDEIDKKLSSNNTGQGQPSKTLLNSKTKKAKKK